MPVRALVGLTVLVAVLAGAGTAAGAPSLLVDSGPALADRIATQVELDAPEGIAGLTLLVPAGYGVDLARAAGERLGPASGTALAGGVELALEGELTVADTSVAACPGGSHAAIWRVSLRAPGVELALLLAVGPAGSAGSGAAYAVSLCTQVPSGLELTGLSLRLADVVTTPAQAGRYAWSALVTAVGAGQAVEARSVSPLPVVLTLNGTYSRDRGVARLSGALRAGGDPVADARVSISSGSSASSLRPTMHAQTGSKGGYEASKEIDSPTVFQASVASTAVTGAVCEAPLVPGGCASETVVVAAATSRTIRVRIPPPPVLELGSRGPAVGQLERRLVELRYLPPGSANASFDMRTWHAVVAFQGWNGLARTGVVSRQTWAKLRRATVPRPWGGLRAGVEIDLARQVLLLVRGGVTVRAIHVSTGAGGRTPRGRFSVRSKALQSWSVPFGVWLPYAQYFYGGFALHSYPSVPTYPASHGCVRLPSMEAPVAYAFTTVGTPVWIR